MEANGRVLDRIEPVAERYLNGRGRRDLEVWKPRRQVRSLAAGHTLRIMAPAEFMLRWSPDDGSSWRDTESTPGGLGMSYFDLPTRPQQAAPLRFTFLWKGGIDQPHFARTAGQWEGKDYRIHVRPAATRPPGPAKVLERSG